MSKDTNEYNYTMEDHFAWKAEQEREFSKMGVGMDYTAKVYEPEDHINYEKGMTKEENALNLDVLHMQLEAKSAENEKMYEEDKKYREEKNKTMEEVRKFERLTPYEKMYELLMPYANYLNKNNNIELSEKIVLGLKSVRTGNLNELEMLLAELKELSKNDESLLYLIQYCEKYFIEFKSEYIEQTKNKQIDQKKENYKKANFFTKIINSLTNKKINSSENEKNKII